jgi:acyl-CoA thioester hydrolase
MTLEMPFSNFRHTLPMPLRWADMDALGHVNNATYLTYLEQARIQYFRELNLWDGQPDKLGLIMAKVVLEYRLPLFADDTVTIYTRCARLGNRSFDTEQLVARQRAGAGALEIAAQGMITIVVFDYRLNQSAPIPDEWRARLVAYEPGLHGA